MRIQFLLCSLAWGLRLLFQSKCDEYYIECWFPFKLLLSLPQVQCLKWPLLFPFWVLILVSFTSWCRGWRHALSRRSVGIERYLLPSIWINYVSPIHVPIWVFSFENDLVLTVDDMIQVIFEEVIVSWAPSLELKWWCHSGLQAIPSVSAWLFLATLCVCGFPGVYWTPPIWMCETSILSVVLYFYY